ncbi:hypothetical protein HanIR_Chr10g0462581 [Helianthus annuus]|nr:hypothetical protein HanIR_Chr10g0462581 [Helianthus annuus]
MFDRALEKGKKGRLRSLVLWMGTCYLGVLEWSWVVALGYKFSDYCTLVLKHLKSLLLLCFR